MSGVYAIEEPRAVASIRSHAVQSSAPISVGSVFSFSASRKRKRNEVVVGADGEGINIYEVQPSRLITSHTLPPHCSLTGALTGTYVKTSKSRLVKRHTYAATRDVSGFSSHTVRRWSEGLTLNNGKLEAEEAIVDKAEWSFGSDSGPIFHLESITSPDTSQDGSLPNLLVITKDGKLMLQSGDLRSQIASHSLGVDQTELIVEFASLQPMRMCQKGLFKHRPDVLSSIDPLSASIQDDKGDTELIIVITRPVSSASTGHLLHAFALRHRSFGEKSKVEFQALDHWPLETQNDTLPQPDGESNFVIEASSGLIYELSAQSLTIHELSIIPKMRNKIRLPQAGAYTMLSIRKGFVLLALQDQCYIYDTKFGSLQAALGLSESGSSHKRKRSASNKPKINVRLASWFSNLQTALAVTDKDMIAIPISMPHKNTRDMDTLLIDTIDKVYIPSTNLKNDKQAADLEELVMLLNGDVLAENVATQIVAFEQKFFELAAKIENGNPSQAHHEQALALKALAACLDWNLTRHRGRRESSTIRVKYFSRHVLEWIVEHKHFTHGNISKALCQNKPPLLGYMPTVTAADMINACVSYDTSLDLLASIVKSTNLTLEGWVESLKHLIRSYHPPATPKRDQLLLTNGIEGLQSVLTNGTTTPLEHNGSLMDEDEEDDDAASVEAAAFESTLAQSELDLSLFLLEPHIRVEALQTCLSRLSLCFASKSLLSAFRSQLSRRDVILLIDLLRVELSSSGWTSHRLDYDVEGEIGFDQADEAIHVIAKLLNVCVDALGIGGWLSLSLNTNSSSSPPFPEPRKSNSRSDQDAKRSKDNSKASTDMLTPSETSDDESENDLTNNQEENNEDIITTLRTAATSTLEAAQESAFFANFLTDFLRYSNSVSEAQRVDHARQRHRSDGIDALPSKPTRKSKKQKRSKAQNDDGADQLVDYDQNEYDNERYQKRYKYRYRDGAATITRPLPSHSSLVAIQNSTTGPNSSLSLPLPLGGAKSAKPISEFRIDAGGEIRRRSRRDIARKMNRKVGIYEFERLEF